MRPASGRQSQQPSSFSLAQIRAIFVHSERSNSVACNFLERSTGEGLGLSPATKIRRSYCRDDKSVVVSVWALL